MTPIERFSGHLALERQGKNAALTRQQHHLIVLKPLMAHFLFPFALGRRGGAVVRRECFHGFIALGVSGPGVQSTYGVLLASISVSTDFEK